MARVRFPFTFMGGLALGIGFWVFAYLAGHRDMDVLSQEVAAASGIVCFGFGGYVLIRRVRRGPQH